MKHLMFPAQQFSLRALHITLSRPRTPMPGGTSFAAPVNQSLLRPTAQNSGTCLGTASQVTPQKILNKTPGRHLSLFDTSLITSTPPNVQMYHFVPVRSLQFIYVRTGGVFGNVFVDFGPQHVLMDANGQAALRRVASVYFGS